MKESKEIHDDLHKELLEKLQDSDNANLGSLKGLEDLLAKEMQNSEKLQELKEELMKKDIEHRMTVKVAQLKEKQSAE
jgi:hypothetical protein